VITEPDVTLTDYGLAILSVLFAYLLGRRGKPRPPLAIWFVVFFLSLGAASLFGGTVHGFFGDSATLGHRVLWPATLIAIGVATLATWIIGARMQFSPAVARALSMAAVVQFLVYCTVVLFVADSFWVAIVNYLPASIFLLVAFVLTYIRVRAGAMLFGVLGILLTFAGAAAQQAGIAIHPDFFDHNALYHVIQAVALSMIFRSAGWLIAAAEPSRA